MPGFTRTDAIRRMAPKDLFHTQQGHDFVEGTLNAMRLGASAGASTIRFPEVRDKLPPHLRQDILRQSYALIESIGRCQLIVIMLEDADPDDTPNAWESYTKIFETLLTDCAQREDDLRKLCKLTLDTYAPGCYHNQSRTANKDY